MISKTTFESRYCKEIHINWLSVDEQLSYKDYVDVQYNVYITLTRMGRDYVIYVVPSAVRRNYNRPYLWEKENENDL